MAIFTNIPKLCSLTTGMNKSFHCYWSRLVKTTGLSQIHTFSHKKWTHSSRNLGRFLVLRHNPHILEWFLGMDLHWGSLLDGWNYHGTRKCRFPFRGRGAGNCRETAPGVGQRELIVGCFVLGVEKKYHLYTVPSCTSTMEPPNFYWRDTSLNHLCKPPFFLFEEMPASYKHACSLRGVSSTLGFLDREASHGGLV